MIKRGFNKLVERGCEWPPSAPEFAKLCQITAEDLDLPNWRNAYSEVGRFRRDKTHKLDAFCYSLYLALRGEFYDLDRLASEKLERRVKEEYKALVAEIIEGRELISQPELLEQKKPELTPAKKETVAAHLKAIKGSLGL